ncbi:MAG: hypothetical protein Athens071412_143 [Parcubacteria group bacterium Athens0714_12]|nr:MAG: hypothetical protein Athens071412_143 [Parcubacteria group bacterium Athens0714_12]
MSYQMFLVPILAGLIAQIIKLSTDGIKGNFKWKNFISDYGKMPSSHTAFVVALAAEMALFQGFKSSEFAISLILALVVIRDATGLRRNMARQNKLLNKICSKIGLKEEQLEETLGHTPLEIFFGCLLGISLVLVFYFI